MNIRHSLSALAVALAISGFGTPALAADYMPVTQEQADQLRVGHSESDVKKICGEPMDVTYWLDGTHSLSYEFNEPAAGAQFLYVDFDATGQLISTQIIERDDGDGESDESASVT